MSAASRRFISRQPPRATQRGNLWYLCYLCDIAPASAAMRRINKISEQEVCPRAERISSGVRPELERRKSVVGQEEDVDDLLFWIHFILNKGFTSYAYMVCTCIRPPMYLFSTCEIPAGYFLGTCWRPAGDILVMHFYMHFYILIYTLRYYWMNYC